MKFIKTITPSTCTQKGEELWACECGKEETRKTNALGHSYGQVQTDPYGKQYRLCTRCGDKDEMEETLTYRITLTVEEGCAFQITEKTEILIHRGVNLFQVIDDVKENLEIELPRDKYTVRADNLGDAYLQTNYCTMDENAPFCEIVIGDNPEYDPEIQGLVNVGDKMFNFLVRDTNKDPEDFVRLYELAKGKKLIYLDFFYCACSPCEYLLDEHLKFYQTLEKSVKDQILVIMIDTYNSETPQQINAFRAKKKLPEEFITVSKGGKIFKHVDNNGGTPHGLFFDEDLICISSSSGANFKTLVEEKVTQSNSAQKTRSCSRKFFVMRRIFREETDQVHQLKKLSKSLGTTISAQARNLSLAAQKRGFAREHN